MHFSCFICLTYFSLLAKSLSFVKFAQEALTFADSSTLSNALFDDSQNPQSTLSQATGVVDEIFLTLDNAFSEELNNNNEWNIDRNDIKNWDTCESDVRTSMVNLKNFISRIICKKKIQCILHPHVKKKLFS